MVPEHGNNTVYPHDLDDDEEEFDSDEDLEEDEEDVISPSTSSPAPISSSAATNAAIPQPKPAPITAFSSAVTVAVPAPAQPASTVTTVTMAIPKGADPGFTTRIDRDMIKQKPQFDDSRRLFQRLWTDEDEIELLQGFLDYTTSHRAAGGSSHHPDTAIFYGLIKSKLQLDFNKNQLVEKLRRLKKKYRNSMSKVDSGKELQFKSPHDQATFEISRKIWSNTGKLIGFEDNMLDCEETSNVNQTSILNFTPNPSPNPYPRPIFELIKLGDGVDKRMMGSTSNSRKRPRSKTVKTEEEKHSVSDAMLVNNNENVSGAGGVGVGDGGGSGGGTGNVAGVIEEAIRSCLSPVLKEMLNGAATMMMMGGTPQCLGVRGGLSPLMMHGMLDLGSCCRVGEMVDEKWRKQQILELEVYAKRLELMQDQIKVKLEDLRANGGL